MLGGTQSLHTNAYDEALALPSESRRARRAPDQQIIAEETGAADTIDPLGGSYAIESLTADIERRVHASSRDRGPGRRARRDRKGYQMRAIEESAYAQQKAIESGEQVIVGVNAYRSDGDDAVPPLQRVDDAVVRGRAERLRAARAKRDRAAAERARADLLTAAGGSANLVAPSSRRWRRRDAWGSAPTCAPSSALTTAARMKGIDAGELHHVASRALPRRGHSLLSGLLGYRVAEPRLIADNTSASRSLRATVRASSSWSRSMRSPVSLAS